MAVKIRMRRMGNRNNPFYRLVVADSRARRDGPSVEVLGFYNPVRQPAEFSIQEERALYWLRQGAKMSDTVKSLFKRQGILGKFTGVSYGSLKSEGEPLSKKARKKAKQASAAAEAPPEEAESAAATAEAPLAPAEGEIAEATAESPEKAGTES